MRNLKRGDLLYLKNFEEWKYLTRYVLDESTYITTCNKAAHSIVLGLDYLTDIFRAYGSEVDNETN